MPGVFNECRPKGDETERMFIQMKRFLISGMVSLLVMAALPSYAEDAPPSATGPGAAAGTADEKPASARKKKKFRRSRHTSDESEKTADRRLLVLSIVEDKVVDLDFEIPDPKLQVSVAKPDVVVPIVGNIGGKYQIVFRPAKEGTTTVTVRDPEGTIKVIFTVRVTAANVYRIAAEIRNLVRDVEGVEIRVVGMKVIVEGEVLVPGDYTRVLRVISDSAYGSWVINLMVLSPLAMQVLARKIQEDINVFAENVKTRVVNGKIFLEGTVDSLDKAQRATRVAELYLPDPKPADPLTTVERDAKKLEGKAGAMIQNFILVSPPPPKKAERLVRVTIHFVELSKDYSKAFGFVWRPGFTSGSDQFTIGTGTGGVGGTGASFSATISSLFPKLKSAQDAGYARVLNTGTIIVRSGQQAKLNQTTEIPYLVQSGTQTAAASAKVSATPMILGSSEDIQLDLDMFENELVSQGASGAPIVATHKVTTKLYVKSNESAAVAAINSSRVKTVFNKTPDTGQFAQNTEELFNLTRSKGYNRSKSQFVIFVTPQIVDNASDGTEDLRKNFRVKVK